MLRSFFTHPSHAGQGLVEYALILVLIAIAVIGVLGALGTEVETVFQEITNGLNPAAGGGSGAGS
ncbi:MAG: Flp family type IVb pilin [Blastochloris sp.]|nr:Flp family type IVb pilin [Blastochloris sp.]